MSDVADWGKTLEALRNQSHEDLDDEYAHQPCPDCGLLMKYDRNYPRDERPLFCMPCTKEWMSSVDAKNADLTRALEESQAREAALRASRDHHKQLMLEAAEESNKLEKERDALRVQLAAVNDDNDALGDKLNAQDSALTESQAMVATLHFALLQALARPKPHKGAWHKWDKETGVHTREGCLGCDCEDALASTAEAAKAHDERMRREERAKALEEAAKWMNDGGWLDVFPDDDGHPVEVPAGDAMLRALARDGKPPTP